MAQVKPDIQQRAHSARALVHGQLDLAALGDVSKYISLKTIKCIIDENIAMYEDVPCTVVKDGKLIERR